MEHAGYMWSAVLNGLITSLTIALASSVLGIGLAFGVGLMRLSPHWYVRLPAATFVEVFRGTAAIVQLFWAFFVLPTVGITLPAIVVGIGVLTLNGGAYGSEIVRGAVSSVPRGQWEGGTVLGLSAYRRMRSVILPQAVLPMIPPFTNMGVDILKNTAFLSLITVTDLTRAVQLLINQGLVDITMGYIGLLVGYFLIAWPVLRFARWCERMAGRRLLEVPQGA